MLSAWGRRRQIKRLVTTGVVLCGLAVVGAYGVPRIVDSTRRTVQRRQFWSRLDTADRLIAENQVLALAVAGGPSGYPGSAGAAADGGFAGRLGAQLLPFRLLYDDLRMLSEGFPPIERAAIQGSLDDFSAEWQQGVDPLIAGGDERGARGAAARVTEKLVGRLRSLE